MDGSAKNVRINENFWPCKFYKAFYFLPMRYYTERPNDANNTRRYTYECNHPLYSKCTLIKKDEKGLAIVQMRYNQKMKVFWYGPLESWLTEQIVKQDKFESYFTEHAEKASDGLYPTVTSKQIMWALRMKPLKKAEWESQLLQLL